MATQSNRNKLARLDVEGSLKSITRSVTGTSVTFPREEVTGNRASVDAGIYRGGT